MTLLPAIFAILGLFVGRWAAAKRGLCPHRSRVIGALALPLVLLLVMMAQAPLVFIVSMAAAIGAGLTAHSTMRAALLATAISVTLATLLVVQAGL